jgi:tryptophanyl-tRNA synthetase
MAEPVQTPQSKFPTRIFSGIQPSGGLTLGNYLGALKRFVEKQDEGIETVYCLVDMHAITVWQDPAKLRQQTREAAAGFIAAGIDPVRSVLFNQSQVTAHVELAWIFNCVARMGWMSRMTQFKDKAGKNSENVSLGLFAYPALMAADILAYKATHVPVGEDQKQHLELCRDIAAKFNNDFGVDYFPITEPVIEGAATRVMSLRDGTKKMSKSDPSDQSRINLTDDADTIAKKIRKAKTDPEPLPSDLEGLSDRPEARNLVNIYAALAGMSAEQVMRDHAGAPFGTFKPALADLAVSIMGPITSEMNRLMQDTAEIDRILGEGAARADAIARPIVDEVYDIVGMIRSRR